jgi:hypothetical protein
MTSWGWKLPYELPAVRPHFKPANEDSCSTTYPQTGLKDFIPRPVKSTMPPIPPFIPLAASYILGTTFLAAGQAWLTHLFTPSMYDVQEEKSRRVAATYSFIPGISPEVVRICWACMRE